jgi:zinc transport system substrate-binding protein
MKRTISIGGVTTACLLATWLALTGGCHKAEDPWAGAKPGQLKVLVSFAPLACFAEGVGGKDAIVKPLLTATGPHDHEPSAAEAHLAAGADLFLINGLELDEPMTAVAKNSRNDKLQIIEVAEVALPDAMRLKMDDDDHKQDKKDEKKDAAKQDHKHDHDHGHGEWDPHAWLGIEQAIRMVETIRDAFKKADSAHAEGYDRRAAEYIEKLKQLQVEGKKLLEGKTNRKLIASHESLRYFCKSFDLDLVDSIQPRPGVEADGGKMAELVKACKEKDVKVIAFEPQYKKNNAQTLADTMANTHKLEVSVIEIDPLETAPAADLNADYYFTVMRRNLETLAKHMK